MADFGSYRVDFFGSFGSRLLLSAWLFGIVACVTSTAFAGAVQPTAGRIAKAQTHKMTLSHHDFEAWSFTPRQGDRIEITNQSDIAHSIYITYPDGSVVTLGVVQLPGNSAIWEVPAAGEYMLQCWIHPIIRAKLLVTKDPAIVSR